ncbi:MAG: hypothetical protein KIH01_03470 [Candidatus Freyarchaeota archaeon]|nr:hypothetical protein [Candidatus Jordarchaeia archaeon]
MIYALWIMKENGENVFFNSYEKDGKVNYSLVSGLLTAIKMFAKDVSGEDASWITLENKTFVYKVTREGYLVLYVDEKEKVDDVFDRLEEAFLSAESGEELAKKVDEIIMKYNRRVRLEKLGDILRKAGGLP